MHYVAIIYIKFGISLALIEEKAKFENMWLKIE